MWILKSIQANPNVPFIQLAGSLRDHAGVCVSLLVLLRVCDAGDGSLALADVADAGPLTLHGLLPQRHLHTHTHTHTQAGGLVLRLGQPAGASCSTSHLVVSTRNRQDVSCDGPADVPDHIVELVQQLGRPRVPGGVVTRPDKHASVLQRKCCEAGAACPGGRDGWRPSHLRAAGDGAGGKADRGSPANVSHPVAVSLQLLVLLPLPILLSAARKREPVRRSQKPGRRLPTRI